MLTEYFSAVTMFAPSLLMSYFYIHHPYNVCTKCVWIGTILHAPFSILYHILCANYFFADPIENIPRKLDQAMIHVCSIACTVGVSRYSTYNAVCIVYNELCVSYIFSVYSTSHIRRFNIFLSVLLYLLPIFYEQYYIIGLHILLYMILCIYCFVYNQKFYGYGQGMFHLLFCGMVYHLHEYCKNAL